MNEANQQETITQLPSDQDATGRTLGQEEIALVTEAIESGTLTCTKGKFVKQLEKEFAKMISSKHCRAVSSGTAAIHTAIAAIDPEPGDEIITTAITDMGAITPILYQTALPVFADVDPDTFNITADTIAPRISSRTKAIIVTHLFGNPCEMDPILNLASEHNLPVIEDNCQAYGAIYNGRMTGALGNIGCFSLQQGKHITSGEGGMVVTDDNDSARRMVLYSDKAWGYGDPNPDHYFLALNYRMTELQGAVALAQIAKLDHGVKVRQNNADSVNAELANIEGLILPKVGDKAAHSYWRYTLRIREEVFAGGVDAFSEELKTMGIFSAPRYIQKPAFMCQVLHDRVTFGKSEFPYKSEFRKGEPDINYDYDEYPGIREALSTVLVLPWNERYLPEHVEFLIHAIKKTAQKLKR